MRSASAALELLEWAFNLLTRVAGLCLNGFRLPNTEIILAFFEGANTLAVLRS
jgi:hypothetical protein